MTDVVERRKSARVMTPLRSFSPLPTARHAMTLIGPLLVASSCILMGALGFTAYAPHGAEAAIGISVGTAALVAMSLTLILAARPRMLEPLFGGLDRMYRVHKCLGISALGLMILHNVIEPDFERSVRETGLGDLAEDAGEFAFNGLLALIAISWFRRLPFIPLEIPYQLWRFSHRFMGVLFSIIVFHQFFVDMPTGVAASLPALLNAFGFVGVMAWVHMEFVAPFLRRRDFTVSAISQQGNTTAVTLTPKGRAMRWRPGQFAFVRAPEAGLSEPHPFTISSAPRSDGTLTLSIRALGDWTQRLPRALHKGMSVHVEGPYGRFDFRKGGPKQLWLAGGIGVTPFLAWAESLTGAEHRDIHLVYCVTTQEEAIGLETLEAATARNPRFSYQVVSTARDGRLTAERLTGSIPFPVSKVDLWFCGPSGLKGGILKGLTNLGQIPRRVHFEHFEFA